MYGEFHGKLVPRSGGAVVEGDFLAYSAAGMVLWRWFLYAWAGLVLVACAVDWQAQKSLLFLVVATAAIVLGYGLPKLYQKNVEAEADLLFEELENLLKERRV